MTLSECYENLHGNYEDTKKRLMSDRLIEKFILKFLTDDSMSILREAAENKDYELAFRGAHNLKGVAANLGFSELWDAASALTEQLRSGKNTPVPELLENVESSYELTTSVIRRYEEELHT